MKLIMGAFGIVTVLTLSSGGAAQTIEKKGLTLDGAKKVIAAAVAEAKSKMLRAEPLPSSMKEAASLRSSGSTILLLLAPTSQSARRGLRSCSNGRPSSSKM